MHEGYGERELARIEATADAAAIPGLVRTVRQQQHDVDSLRLGLDVATRDREELRSALVAAQAELRALRGFVRARGLAAEFGAYLEAEDDDG